MKVAKSYIVLFLFFFIGITLNTIAQCKSDVANEKRPFFEVETECAKNNSDPSFLTDGKEYRALLSNNEASEFVIVFYANNTYRIAACTDIGGPLSFIVRDKEKNILFSNKNYENAPYWDLIFPTSVECIVTINLPEETRSMAAGGNVSKEAEEQVDSSSDASTEAVKSSKKNTIVSDVCAVLLVGYKQE